MESRLSLVARRPPHHGADQAPEEQIHEVSPGLIQSRSRIAAPWGSDPASSRRRPHPVDPLTTFGKFLL